MTISLSPLFDSSTGINNVHKEINKSTAQESLNLTEDIIQGKVNLTSKPVDGDGQSTKQDLHIAIDEMNSFFKYSQRSSKFVYHEQLERYYIEVVDTRTQEIVKEIPPKELLDAYYEMKKLSGKAFDIQA